MPKVPRDVLYRVRGGGSILDTERVIAFLRKHGDREYHWVLESGELSMVRLVVAAFGRVGFLGVLAFFVPYALLTYWTWRPAQVVIISISILGIVGLAVVMRVRRVRWRSRANPVRLVGSVQRLSDWTNAKLLTICAGLLAALMFAPEWFIRDGFEYHGWSFWAPLTFLSFQVARVFSLDTIEIAGWNWSSIATSSRLSVATTVALNVFISLGALNLVIQAVRESGRRAETIVGNTFDVYRLLRHEPFLGGKWVVVHGLVSGVEERAITGFEFVQAYEERLMPTSAPPDRGEPAL